MVSMCLLQGLDIYLSRLAATHEEVATHCGRGPAFPASLMLEPRLHSQVGALPSGARPWGPPPSWLPGAPQPAAEHYDVSA